MSSAGKQYGLLIRKKTQPLLSSKSVFDDSDDEPENKKVESLIKKESIKNQMKRQTKVEMKKALEEDPTVYDYDKIYDDMQKKKDIARAAVVPPDRKPRYIQSLLKSAEQRKKDNERRIERQIQKERQEEGETYADKEAFVTSAYKKKMQEMQEEEEREAREKQLEEMMDVTKQKDLSGFYRHFLNQSTGEEAIPEFGQRFSSTSTKVKTERISPPPEDRTSPDEAYDKAKDALLKNRLTDSTSDDARIEEGSNTPSDTSARKHNKEDADSDFSDHSSQEASMQPPGRPVSGSENESSSPERDGVEKETKERPRRTSRKRDRSPLPSNDDCQSKKMATNSKHLSVSLDSSGEEKKEKVSIVKPSIFEKRTVGVVLAEAKARYIARKEARETVRQVFASA